MSDEVKFSSALDRLNIALCDYEALNNTRKPASKMLEWFNEVVLKNAAIYRSKANRSDHEKFAKLSKNVYRIDFGMTIGSEFQDVHFAVVLREQEYTAVVIPLTTKKEVPPAWAARNDLVDIGVVNGFPYECKECYAYIGAMQSVSKKRLDFYRDKSRSYEIRLSDEQFALIKRNIAEKILEMPIDKPAAS